MAENASKLFCSCIGDTMKRGERPDTLLALEFRMFFARKAVGIEERIVGGCLRAQVSGAPGVSRRGRYCLLYRSLSIPSLSSSTVGGDSPEPKR